MVNIETIYDLLDNWRGLPSYQLERRADIYFAYYLPQIIMNAFPEDHINEKITHGNIVPEFPLKKDENRQSNKVDYVVFCEKKLYLIELKTDSNSLDYTQRDYLKSAKDKSLFELISIIPELAIGSEQRQKYMHLLKYLKEMLWMLYKIEIKSETATSMYQKKHFITLVNEFDEMKEEFDARKIDVEVVYILPKDDDLVQKSGIKHIGQIVTFEKIVEWLKEDNIRFCDSLMRWVEPPHSP
jgi:hypothetical protein